MSSKSTEQTLRPLGSSLSQIQNPVAVVEEAVAVDVAGVEEVEMVVENRNKRANPLARRLPVMDRPAIRGNAASNLMVVNTPEWGVRYLWLGQRQRKSKRTKEVRDCR